MKLLSRINKKAVPIPENHAEDWSGYYTSFVEKDRLKRVLQTAALVVPVIQSSVPIRSVAPTPTKVVEVKIQSTEQQRRPVPTKPKFEF